ncbi:MAG: hypothetical protein OXN15_05035 [Chloroflexota bacterium]|nr:hypothetical protein [Chloroflexota bacterium]MDE2968677.1 hypothetical protein [Chloroflexota bacterium]
MQPHSFDTEFRITPEHKLQYMRDGFVKLEGFLNPTVIDMLLDRTEREMRGSARNTTTGSAFSRVQYDFESEKHDVYEMMARPYFRKALTELVDHDLFLTFEVCFEIEQLVNEGFGWHVGVQSFGFQFSREFGCTLWAPLQPVDPQGQRGGMAYVPQNVISGEFMYDQLEPAVVSTLRAKERAGVRTSFKEYNDLRSELLNTPSMTTILETHQVEDDFQPGDVLVFNKWVVHRSITLEEGELPRRAAYVMRLVDAESRYDLQRAQNLELPAELYSRGPFPYKPVTRQHIEIAEAGAADGDKLSECAYFDDRDRRTIRRG